MTELTQQSQPLQECLFRLQAGDATARDPLVGHVCARLQRLTRRMLRDTPASAAGRKPTK